jgi:hypothetical protein
VLAARAGVIAAGSLYGSDCRPLLMAAAESLDIDTPADLDLLAYYMARRS